jgi:chromosome segregation ATPase
MFSSISDDVEISFVTSLLALVGTVIGAWLSYLAQKRATQARDHAFKASTEVTNNHDVNLRDDLDRHFDGIDKRFDAADKRLDGIESDIRGIRRDVGRAQDERRDLSIRIHDLEVPPVAPADA